MTFKHDLLPPKMYKFQEIIVSLLLLPFMVIASSCLSIRKRLDLK